MSSSSHSTSSHISKLICSVCGLYLSYFPIYQSKSMNKICGRCASGVNKSNYLHVEIYEVIAQDLSFPCRYQMQGCCEIHVPADIPNHEDSCRYRTSRCPMQKISSTGNNSHWQDAMDNTPTEIIIPTFVNPHLFWIIVKKQLLIRSAINKLLTRREHHQEIKEFHKMRQSTMIAVWVEGTWARARVHRVIEHSASEPGFTRECQYLCWLLDYGIMRLQNQIFYLPGDLKTVPPIARQASLHNVVNLITEWSSIFQAKSDLKKTAEHSEGTRKRSLDLLGSSSKLYFLMSDEDEFTLYGDILFVTAGKEDSESLTAYMLDNKLMDRDEEVFNSIDASRRDLIEEYYKGSQIWSKPLDNTIDRDRIFFNTEENPFKSMEYLTREQDLRLI